MFKNLIKNKAKKIISELFAEYKDKAEDYIAEHKDEIIEAIKEKVQTYIEEHKEEILDYLKKQAVELIKGAVN